MLTELHALAERQEDAAQAVVDAWEEADRPGEIEHAVPSDAEIVRRGWPGEGAFIAIARRVWELIGPEVTIHIVPAGSTAATTEAARVRKMIEP